MSRARKSVTAREAAGLLFVLVILAGLALGGYELYVLGHHRYVLRTSIPKALDLVGRQRNELVAAIEEYKRHFGFYPPAPVQSGQQPGIVNPLFYELAGTRYKSEPPAFYDRTQKEPLAANIMAKTFGIEAFTNSAPFPAWPPDFLTPHQLPKQELQDGLEVYGVGLNTAELPEEVLDAIHLTSWRYQLAAPAHNRGSFDLWIEITVAGHHYLVGNWPGADGE